MIASVAPGRHRARRQGDEQGLGGLAHRPTARAGRDRGRTGFWVARYAAAIQCLHAEHFGVGTGDCQDEQLRFLGSQGPCRYARCPRRRSGGGRNRRFAGPHAGKTYRPSGPELISNYDVADVLSRLLGRTITYRELRAGPGLRLFDLPILLYVDSVGRCSRHSMDTACAV